MRTTLVGTFAAVIFSACASAPVPEASEPPPSTAEAASPDAVFANLASGGAVHLLSQAECPASFAGYTFKSADTYAADGTDVGCQYANEKDAAVTLYFSRFGDRFTAEGHAVGAAQHIKARWPEAEFDEDESKKCRYSIDLKSGLADMLAADAKGEDREIKVGVSPCYVFEIDRGATAVAVKVVMPWHLKIRITDPAGASAFGDMSETISTMLFALEANVSGSDNSDLKSVLDDLIEDDEEQQKTKDAI